MRRTATLGCLVLMAMLISSCQEEATVKVKLPLTVLHVHPSSGAAVTPDLVTPILVVFSRPLGSKEAVQVGLKRFIQLVRHPRGDEEEAAVQFPIGKLEVEYLSKHQRAKLHLPEEITRQLVSGDILELLIKSGLESDDGAVLPVDLPYYFKIAPALPAID